MCLQPKFILVISRSGSYSSHSFQPPLRTKPFHSCSYAIQHRKPLRAHTLPTSVGFSRSAGFSVPFSVMTKVPLN